MNLKRTATIVLGGAAVGAWLAGAATSNHTIPATPLDRPAAIEMRGAELAREIARLQERLRPSASPRQRGRNLFAFRAAAPPVTPSPFPSARPLFAEAAPLPPALPSLKLAGIAEDTEAESPIRTAIISGEGQLYMVKEGEAVTTRYRVTKISADVVELVDLLDNSVRRLALR
jgi:Tfp pilus assembly protein PilP